jgi:hypothetical protein
MKIDDDHMYHGAALLQIAEHPRFTAINTIEIAGQKSRSAYRINDNIGIFLKYASNPSKNLGEYVFQFTNDHLQELEAVAGQMESTFIALVCVRDREIACLTLDELQDMVERRKKKKGSDEERYVVLVTARRRQSLRAYVNMPDRKGIILGKQLVIKRQAFPERLFPD